MKFSIITVTLNSGDKLLDTISSVLNQSFVDYEVIVKDGGSTDGSIEKIQANEKIRIINEPDCGIYDAMNKASKYVTGDYVLFLNSGDLLYNDDVLKKVSQLIGKSDNPADTYYGDAYVASRDGIIRFSEKLNDYILMTKTICHQCIFFSKRIFDSYKYENEKYKMAADLDLYLRCLKKEKMSMEHLPIIIVSYEGKGVSESVESRKLIAEEKAKIYKEVFTKFEFYKVELLKLITLIKLKERLSYSKWFNSTYEKIASFIYHIRMV